MALSFLFSFCLTEPCFWTYVEIIAISIGSGVPEFASRFVVLRYFCMVGHRHELPWFRPSDLVEVIVYSNKYSFTAISTACRGCGRWVYREQLSVLPNRSGVFWRVLAISFWSWRSHFELFIKSSF